MQALPTFKLLGIVMFIQSLTSGLFLPLLFYVMVNIHPEAYDFFQTENIISNAELGTFFIFSLCPAYLLLAPLIGVSSDELGRKNFFIATISSTLIGYSLIWCSVEWNSFLGLLGGIFFFSLSKLYFPLLMAMIADISKGKKRAAFFGCIYGLIVVILLAAQFGYYIFQHQSTLSYTFTKILLFLMIVLETISILIIYFKLPETHQIKPHMISLTPQTILSRMVYLFRIKFIRRIFFWLLFCYFIWGLYFQLISHTLTSHLHMNTYTANLFIFYILCIMLASLLFIYPRIIKRITYLRLLGVLSITMVGFIGCGLLPFFWAQVIFAIPVSMGVGLTVPLLWTLLSHRLKSSHQGLLMGLIGPGSILCWILGGIITLVMNHYSFACPLLTVGCGGLLMLFVITSFSHKLILRGKLNE